MVVAPLWVVLVLSAGANAIASFAHLGLGWQLTAGGVSTVCAVALAAHYARKRRAR
ncbi:hypothetical protein [Actinosynnema sp. NPDC020468]|uniref:hypothetical protein n=1 Tax=Actinosynnema sp. NPDC020468 TaxID=3154488 RepID=UPI0033D2E684